MRALFGARRKGDKSLAGDTMRPNQKPGFLEKTGFFTSIQTLPREA